METIKKHTGMCAFWIKGIIKHFRSLKERVETPDTAALISLVLSYIFTRN